MAQFSRNDALIWRLYSFSLSIGIYSWIRRVLFARFDLKLFANGRMNDAFNKRLTHATFDRPKCDGLLIEGSTPFGHSMRDKSSNSDSVTIRHWVVWLQCVLLYLLCLCLSFTISNYMYCSFVHVRIIGVVPPRCCRLLSLLMFVVCSYFFLFIMFFCCCCGCCCAPSRVYVLRITTAYILLRDYCWMACVQCDNFC